MKPVLNFFYGLWTLRDYPTPEWFPGCVRDAVRRRDDAPIYRQSHGGGCGSRA